MFLILFGSALALPLLGLAVFGLERMAALEEAEIEGRVLQVAESVAGDVDRELERVTVTLDTLATSNALARGDLAAFHDQASRALKRDRAGILIVDRTFQQRVNTRVSFATTLPKTQDPNTAQRVFDTGQRMVSDLFMGVVSGEPIINVWVPVPDGEAIRYVMSMALEATRFSSLLKDQGLGNQWVLGITDNNGVILARSDRHAEFVGKPLPKDLLEKSRTAQGTFRATSVAGEDILRATVRSKIAGWLVSATVPVSYLEEARKRSRILTTAMVAIALAVGGGLAYVLGGFMARPLDAATRSAMALGAGQPVEPLKSPLLEANTLTTALSEASAELKRRSEHSALLMRELAHRSKNQLAVVNGMAIQTARQSVTVDQFVEQFGRRIQGLSRSLDVMVRRNWQGAGLSDLVRAHLDLFGIGGRAEIDGPALFLNAHAVQNIGFALHELATNATKHGALSKPDGRVAVRWRDTGADGRIHIEWIERDGPSVQPPIHKGFGHLVVTQLVAQALEGEAELDFPPHGLRWRLSVPKSRIVDDSAETGPS